MNRFIICVVVVLLLIVLQSCSNDNNASLEGTWLARQASQTIAGRSQGEMLKYIITNYNHWEMKDGKMSLSNYSIITSNGKEEMEVVPSGIEVSYEVISESEIKIDNKLFDFEIKKQKMILKSDDLEIELERENWE